MVNSLIYSRQNTGWEFWSNFRRTYRGVGEEISNFWKDIFEKMPEELLEDFPGKLLKYSRENSHATKWVAEGISKLFTEEI